MALDLAFTPSGHLTVVELATEGDAVLDAVERVLVCYLDCTGLTEWNDRHGWTGGDRLLRCFARTFTEQLGPRFETVRLMGDVFAVCGLLGSEIDPSTDANAIHALADRLMRAASDGRVGFRLIWHVFGRSEIAAVDRGCRLLEDAARTHREPTAVALPPSTFVPGVGDRLHDLIAWLFGQRAVDGCGCGAVWAEMNELGVDGCRREIDRLAARLVEIATQKQWLIQNEEGQDVPEQDIGKPVPQTWRTRTARGFARVAAKLPAGMTLIEWQCRRLVLLAIRRAERAERKSQVEISAAQSADRRRD